jgi:uncharacterized protein YvpB
MLQKWHLFFVGALFFIPLHVHAATILDVPFTAQAPQNQWRTQPFRDACEETSIAMVNAFYHGTKLSPIQTRAQILDYVNYEMKNFGFHKDTNAGMTAKLINERSEFFARTTENATIANVRDEIDAGHPVIFHAYAPALKNPYFKQPMNPYHVFVIIGYDDETQEFIANDPGTNHGKHLRYSFETLIAANHDWVPKNNVGQGAALMIFTEK